MAINFTFRPKGVCFRMYTEAEAKKMGLVGWVKNTSQGTVVGQVQGPEEKVNSMSPGAAIPTRLRFQKIAFERKADVATETGSFLSGSSAEEDLAY
ncbi:acylphosphatase-2 isoform X5 [Ornithorhynchus anatinus]|uniref:acylphosphatase-2 isoform X5 n=1 Tax=Ornithorhynchus anatinus TaxID=9258 RepID=UPI0010A9489C|nr:acylphosphatase-2 isoform X5 [Ornithorhynchus anatinus]